MRALARTCAATTRGGAPCPAPPLGDSTYCWAHDQRPEVQERRALARRQGGLQHARLARRAIITPAEEIDGPAWWGLASVDDIRQGLVFVAQAVMTGRMGAREGNAVTGTLQATLGILTQHRDLLPPPPMPAPEENPCGLNAAQRDRVREILCALVDRVKSEDVVAGGQPPCSDAEQLP